MRKCPPYCLLYYGSPLPRKDRNSIYRHHVGEQVGHHPGAKGAQKFAQLRIRSPCTCTPAWEGKKKCTSAFALAATGFRPSTGGWSPRTCLPALCYCLGSCCRHQSDIAPAMVGAPGVLPCPPSLGDSKACTTALALAATAQEISPEHHLQEPAIASLPS